MNDKLDSLRSKMDKTILSEIEFGDTQKRHVLASLHRTNKPKVKKNWFAPLLTVVFALSFLFGITYFIGENTEHSKNATQPPPKEDVIQKEKITISLIDDYYNPDVDTYSGTIAFTVNEAALKNWQENYLTINLEIEKGQIQMELSKLKELIDKEGNGKWTFSHSFKDISNEGRDVFFNQGKVNLYLKIHGSSGTSRIIQTIKLKDVSLKNDADSHFALTPEEQNLYTLYKSDFSSNHLQGIDPISVAKLYVQAGIDQNFDMQYALYTTRKDYVQWSKEEDEQFSESDRGTKDHYMSYYRNLDKGLFIQSASDKTRGYIRFQGENEISGFQMIKDSDGTWKVSFMPIQ